MSRSKKIFLVIATVFLIIVALVVMDFSRKTTFPGKKAKQDPTASTASVAVRR